MKDSGNMEAALPTRTSPRRIELTPIDFPGLKNQCKIRNKQSTCYLHEQIEISNDEHKTNLIQIIIIIIIEVF
jgi:hypothetical protein